MLKVIRGRGRPKGSRNNSGIQKWQPSKWKFEYELMVLLSVSGKTAKEISELLPDKRTETFVGMVLRSEKGKEVIERIRGNLPEKDLTERYKDIVDKATKRLEKFIGDDGLFESNLPMVRMGAIDRAARAVELLDKNLRKESSVGSVTNNTLVLASRETVDELLNGLRKSEEVTKLHRIANVAG